MMQPAACGTVPPTLSVMLVLTRSRCVLLSLLLSSSVLAVELLLLEALQVESFRQSGVESSCIAQVPAAWCMRMNLCSIWARKVAGPTICMSRKHITCCRRWLFRLDALYPGWLGDLFVVHSCRVCLLLHSPQQLKACLLWPRTDKGQGDQPLHLGKVSCTFFQGSKVNFLLLLYPVIV